MKNLLLITALTLLLGAAQCGSVENIQLGEPFSLQLGQQVQSERNALQFTSVKEDSRCPKYTNCLWEGQVVVQLMLGDKDRQAIDLALRPNEPAAAQGMADGYIYTLQEVNPYPQAGQSIKMEDYIITLVVEAI